MNVKLKRRLSACLLTIAVFPAFAGSQDAPKNNLQALFSKKKATVVLAVADGCPMVYENISTFGKFHKILAAENKNAQFIIAIDRNPDQYKKKWKSSIGEVDVIQASKSFFNEHKITNANELLIFDQEGRVISFAGVRQHYKGTSQENWTNLAKSAGVASAPSKWVMDWKNIPVKGEALVGCELNPVVMSMQQNKRDLTNRQTGFYASAMRLTYSK